jgi:hypothetical protein
VSDPARAGISRNPVGRGRLEGAMAADAYAVHAQLRVAGGYRSR